MDQSVSSASSTGASPSSTNGVNPVPVPTVSSKPEAPVVVEPTPESLPGAAIQVPDSQTVTTPVSSQNPEPLISQPKQIPPSSPEYKVAQPVGPRWPLFVGVGIAVLALLGLGYVAWGRIRPQSVPTPTPTNTPQPTRAPQPSTAPGGIDNTICTMDAKICPDGSSVGRQGPNCEFAACPGETTKGGVPTGSSTTQTAPASTSTSTADWDTYKNPKYFVSFRFPMDWEVIDAKQSNSQLAFTHIVQNRRSRSEMGELSVWKLPVAEALEKTKQATPNCQFTESASKTVGPYTAQVLLATCTGDARAEYHAIAANDYTYVFSAQTMNEPRGSQMLGTLAIE